MDTLLGYSHTDLDASFPGMVSKDVAAVRLQAGFVLEFELSTTHTTSLLRSSNITNNNVVFVSSSVALYPLQCNDNVPNGLVC